LFLPTEIESIQASATTQATSGADCWGQSVPSTGYDRYGNLLTINGTQGGSGLATHAAGVVVDGEMRRSK